MRLLTPIRWLVYLLPLFLVTFAVVMGGAGIGRAMGDHMAARTLTGFGIAFAVLICVDLILLVGLLGARAAMEFDRGERHRRRRNLHREHPPRD